MGIDDFDHVGGAPYGAPRMGRLVHIAGGITSVALVLGAVVWGYKLAVRSVEGIPIVRALEGPMRVAPEVPGGSVADHQGLAVNAVAEIGTAAPLPDQLTLAPRPVELQDEDVAGLGVFDQPEEATLLTASAGLADPATLGAPAVDATAVEAALAEALTPEEQMAAASADLLDAGAPMRSLFPRRRPGAVSAAAPAPAALDAVQDVVAMATPLADPATIAVGTPLVQLGTFNTEDDARKEWARIEARFADLLGGKAVVLQPAKSGGSTFIRLRAQGFASEDDARRFCTALLSENTACVPTAHR
jgi:SPOR domain